MNPAKLLLALCTLVSFCMLAVLGVYSQQTGMPIKELLCPIAGLTLVIFSIAAFAGKIK